MEGRSTGVGTDAPFVFSIVQDIHISLSSSCLMVDKDMRFKAARPVFSSRSFTSVGFV